MINIRGDEKQVRDALILPINFFVKKHSMENAIMYLKKETKNWLFGG